MTQDDRVERLERRIERERRARAEAEEIAERGMRDLWLANRDLESRVRERTAELERSLLAARQASAAKESFLADLGHGLATPLHAVLGHLELIDRDALERDDRIRLETATTNAEQLATLLRGLVDLAGAEGAATLDEIEHAVPASWLDDLVAAWNRRAAARGQLLVPACAAPAGQVAAPWHRLRQIVDLLLDNAVTHAASGPLRIELDVVAPGDDGESAPAGTITCRVIDCGPGLDDGQLATAMEPFVRFGVTEGLGIGLSRADRLARAAGGSVTLVSSGASTEASVTVPATVVPDD